MGVIAKQSIRGTIVTYIGVAVGFVTTFFVLTRFLTTEEVGLARVLVDAATLFIGLAQLGTTSSIIRFYPYFKEPDDSSDVSDHGFFFWTLVVPLAGFILFSIVYCVCNVPLGHWFDEKSPLFMDYYYAILPLAFFMLYQSVFETNANVLMRIVVPRAVREIGVRVGLLAVYLLYAFRVLSLDGFVASLGVVYAVAAVINVFYVFSVRRITLRPDWAFLREHKQVVRRYLRYTLFLFVSALASVLAPVLSSFFITAQMGLNYTGIFAIATYMATMVSIPYRSVTAIAAPQLAAAIKERDRRQTITLIRQCSNNLLLIGGMIFLLIWINIDLIYHILPNGTTYAAAKNVVFILGLSQLILATFNIVLSALNYSRFYAFSLLYSVVLTVTALVLNNRLIPLYGIDGAALSNLLSYALYFLLIVGTLHIAAGVSPWSRNMFKTLALLLAVFAADWVWQRWLPIPNLWLSSLVRTAVLMGAGAVIAFRYRLSPEINEWINSRRV